jgi:hypothetical protein
MLLNKHKLLILTILPVFIGGLLSHQSVKAAGDVYDDVMSGYQQVEKGVTGENENVNIRYVILDIIRVVLGFVGLIFFILILVSGFQWMTAGGNGDAVKKARDRMIHAVIGLLIIVAAYSITLFIIENLTNAADSWD